MPLQILDSLDFSRSGEPQPTGDPGDDLLAWLHYQRHEFLRKLRDLSAAQLAEWSVPPLELSVLDVRGYLAEVARADAAVAALPAYEAAGLGHGRPLGYTLLKMIHEYAPRRTGAHAPLRGAG